MKSRILSHSVAALAALSLGTSAKAELKVGDKAPIVSCIDQDGNRIDLGQFYKRQAFTLVYFFPKADTPGCTAQGCSLRDAYQDLTKEGVAVLGVSLDSADAQKAFRDKFHFPFPLAADPDKVVVDAFGVGTRLVPGFGEFANREAFLIRDGVIIWADYKATPKTQAADVLKVLAGLKAE